MVTVLRRVTVMEVGNGSSDHPGGRYYHPGWSEDPLPTSMTVTLRRTVTIQGGQPVQLATVEPGRDVLGEQAGMTQHPVGDRLLGQAGPLVHHGDVLLGDLVARGQVVGPVR